MSPSTGRPAIDAPARSCDAARAWAGLLPVAEVLGDPREVIEGELLT